VNERARKNERERKFIPLIQLNRKNEEKKSNKNPSWVPS
jgi:hypothetical protein